jgi:hypothetical protein
VFETDYSAIGLTFANPWDVLKPREAAPPVKKKSRTSPKRTKMEWALIGLESEEQRKTRQAAERQKRMAEILRKNKYSDIAISTRGAGDRAAMIRKSGVC